jgi:hypothetical protein
MSHGLVMEDIPKPSTITISPSDGFSSDDEKQIKEAATEVSEVPVDVQYDQDEERAVVRKLDLIVMPLLFLGFYVFQVSPSCTPCRLSRRK